MDALGLGIATSLVGLAFLLGVLSARSFAKFLRRGVRAELWWGSGLTLATAAMAVEAAVYFGVVTVWLLQAYIFFSAAIVGVLSLGATRVLRRPRVERAYTYYTLGSCLAVAVFSFATAPPSGMVTGGIITGNPSALLLILSSFVTVPATVVLLAASAVSLRRNWRWQTVLMAAGAIVLGAGGALYIASFPVALYYAEFIGILVLFLGLVSLPQTATTSAASGTPSRA